MIPKILNEFCRQIINVFAPEHLPKEFLTQEKLEECIQGFEELGFPQCFGVLGNVEHIVSQSWILIIIFVDGTHIEIRPPVSDAEDYCNIKGWYSTILIALVDHR